MIGALASPNEGTSVLSPVDGLTLDFGEVDGSVLLAEFSGDRDFEDDVDPKAYEEDEDEFDDEDEDFLEDEEDEEDEDFIDDDDGEEEDLDDDDDDL